MTGKGKKKKNKPKTLLGKFTKFIDQVIVVLGIFLGLFIITMVVTFWKFQSVPDTLIEAVLNTGKFEAALTASITIVKLIFKKEYGTNDETESFEENNVDI